MWTSEGQKETLKKTLESKSNTIIIRPLKFEDLNGEDIIAITKSQYVKMANL